MYRFMLFKPGWWVLHIVTIALIFWLGHLIDL
jgi:hypothetical protein